ncbi:MAG: AAA family ATPase [Smithellaceae bacterium]|jgi:ATP-dependent DNA helicase PIF1|nr:AAA family ATPase [Smithellaceae bacterium]MDD3258385.1 AAA family ATPase [Smithellaceae bacterium]MDD3849098.1 AAA family ATPase [Smithellaceae bacterium]HOG11508.1 AAA family ATPase [Smithellaceae bacterium]HOQ71819.1 AAA family ATPase [Smithellaceae bacterium]
MNQPSSPVEIDFNSEFQRAISLMEDTQKHILITGRAGTGKSTLLKYFRDTTSKKAVILAPTGVAAVNVEGQTIHSFFHFKPNVTPASIKRRKKAEKDRLTLYQKLTTIVIDEISMVRADLLDCVDKFLRFNGPSEKKPFGGVQMIFIGDLYQLPPVVSSAEREIFKNHYPTPYFFSAKVFEALDIEYVELEKVYRQKDDEFVRLLNTIRNRSVTDDDLAKFNSRCDPFFEAPSGSFYLALTSTNDLADTINEKRLAELPGKIWKAKGQIEGDFGKEYLPTAVDLKLKKNAQIMMLNNDSFGQWINGTIGKIRKFEKDDEGDDVIVAELDNGDTARISPYTWKIYRFFIKDEELRSEEVGSFRQYPVRLAFAVTIHKSQGKTFENVVIDVGRGTFAHGQMYVALSRCTTLDGIVLKKPLQKSHILMDWRVVKFLTNLQYARAAKTLSREDKIKWIEEAIAEKKDIEILYLKSQDEKSRRTVRPLFVGKMEYKGYPYLGLEAICLERREKRIFNVDKILEIGAEKR